MAKTGKKREKKNTEAAKMSRDDPESQKLLSKETEEGDEAASSTQKKPWFYLPSADPRENEKKNAEGTDKEEKDEISSCQTFFNICNANLGTGVLAMPFVIRLAGLWGVVIIIFIGFLGNYTGKILIDCLYETDGAGKRKRVRQTYPEIGEAFHSTYGACMVHVANCFDQFSHCALFLIMIGMVMKHAFPVISFSESDWTLIIGLLILPAIFIRKMTQLAWLGTLTAWTAIVISIVVVVYSFTKCSSWTTTTPPFNIHTVPIAIGVVMVSYSSAAYLPKMETAMVHPEEYNSIMNFSYSAVTFWKFFCGIIVYMTFTDATDQIVALNLPRGPFRGVLCVAVVVLALFFFTVPAFTIFDIVENHLRIPWLAFNCTNNRRVVVSGYLLRLLLMLFTLVLAVCVPHFSLLMAFVGCSTGMVLVLIFPCMFHLKLRWPALRSFDVAAELFVIVFAVIGGTLGIIYSSLALYTVYNET